MIPRRALSALVDRWLRSEQGTSLVEFAIVLPVMLALYLGGFQLSDAIACNRKVTVTARSIADLTSQYSGVTMSQIDTILAASRQVMSPYDPSSTLVRVSEITVDNNYRSTVTWSRAINGGGRTPGSTFPLPAAMTSPGISMIYAEVSYPYTPMVRVGMLQPVTLSEHIYMMPRVANSVVCNDCPTS